MEAYAKKIVFGQRLRLIPMSDLHMGSRACDKKKLHATRKYILDTDDTYCIGGGDYANYILRQDSKRFDPSDVDPVLLEDLDSALDTQIQMVENFFRPLAEAGKLLGLAEGNHEDSMKKHHSINPLKMICRSIDVPYLGYSYFYRLTLQKKNQGVRRNCVIYGHHGFGSGRKPGSSVNRLLDMANSYEADIIISGHDHYKIGTTHTRLMVSPSGKPKIKHKEIALVRTGTFLKTAIPGTTTYSEKFGYPPTDTGVVKIKIGFKGHDKELDIHVSE